MEAYFVALTPDEKNYSKISEAKKEIFQKFRDQKFLKDSPHSTLYVSLTEDLNEVEKRLEDLVSKESSISTIVQNKYIEFKEDKLAGGGTSIGLKFDEEANEKIQSLQKRIVDVLNELRNGQIHPRYKNAELPISMSESIQKYGFPFVNGENNKPILIPHINFCCFNLPENAEKFKEIYQSKKFSGPINFSKLSLYKLCEDDKTELIRDFELQ